MTQGLHTLSSSPLEDPLHPVPHETALIIINETSSRASFRDKPQQSLRTCTEAPSLVLSSSEQELQRNRCECAMYSCSAPALSGTGSAPRALSVGLGTGIASCRCFTIAVSKTSETNASQNSPHARAAPMLPNAMPIHSSQVPLQRGYENIVNNINGLTTDHHSPACKTVCSVSNSLSSVMREMTCIAVNKVSVTSTRAEPPQTYITHVEALSLVPGLSEQGPQMTQHEHTISSRTVPKEPDKARGKRAQESLLPSSMGARPLV